MGVRNISGTFGATGAVVVEFEGGDGTDPAEETKELVFAEVVVEVSDSEAGGGGVVGGAMGIAATGNGTAGGIF